MRSLRVLHGEDKVDQLVFYLRRGICTVMVVVVCQGGHAVGVVVFSLNLP